VDRTPVRRGRHFRHHDHHAPALLGQPAPAVLAPGSRRRQPIGRLPGPELDRDAVLPRERLRTADPGSLVPGPVAQHYLLHAHRRAGRTAAEFPHSGAAEPRSRSWDAGFTRPRPDIFRYHVRVHDLAAAQR
jgi:hypothetical protein